MIDINDIYESHAKPFVFSDLSEDKQKIIFDKKCIIFQGQFVTLRQLLTPTKYVDTDEIINSDLLQSLLQKKEITVGRGIQTPNGNTENQYVNRKCVRFYERLSEKEMCDIETRNIDWIFTIHGLSGSGKTFFLDKLWGEAKKNNPFAWVIKIDITDYRNQLLELKTNQKEVTVQDLLNSKPDTQMDALEMKIFSIRHKIILLIDGIDELGPEYKPAISEILKDCETRRNFARVFVTKSPKLDDEFIEFLWMKYSLEPPSKLDQVEILSKFWEGKFGVTEKCKVYAESLIGNKWIEEGEETLVGVALKVKTLGEVLTSKQNFLAVSEIGQGCEEFINNDENIPTLPNKFSLLELFQLYIRKTCCYSIQSNTKIREDILKINQKYNNYFFVLALETVLSSEQCQYFKCYQANHTIPEKELQSLSIIKKINNQFKFIHSSIADYFLAECIAMEYNHNDTLDFINFLLKEIFVLKRFTLVRFFLNNLVKNDWTTISKSTVLHIRSILGYAENFHMSFAKILIAEGNLELFKLLFKHHGSFTSITGVDFNVYLTRVTGENLPHIAMQSNHLEAVEFLLTHGADINFRDDNGQTLLHIAAKNGYTKAVEFLLCNGAIVNCKDYHGRTPLHEATAFGPLTMVEALLSNGADINSHDFVGHTALHEAVKNNSLEKVQILLKNGAEVNSTCKCYNDYCLNPVFAAVRVGNLPIVQLLVENGAKLTGRNDAGHFILHYFIEGNHEDDEEVPKMFPNSVKMCDYLIKQGVSVDTVDKDGNTVLHSVINVQDDVALVRYLLGDMVELDCRNHSGQTALDKAVEVGAVKIAKYLMEQEVLRPVPTRGFAYSIVKASGEGHLSVLEYLSKQGVSLKVEDCNRNSLLHRALSCNKADIVKFLVGQGVPFEGVNQQCETVGTLAAKNCDDDIIRLLVEKDVKTEGMLEVLIEKGRLEIVRFLVEKGATVENVRNVDGNLELLQYLVEKGFDIDKAELLYKATRRGDLDIIRYFCSVGNIPSGIFFNIHSSTLLHVATTNDQPHVVKYLLKKNLLNVDVRNGQNDTALFLAVDEGYLTDSIRVLLDFGANVEAVDAYSGNTVLCEAAYRKNLDLVKALVGRGANIEARNKDWDNAIELALKNGELKIVEFLAERQSMTLLDVVTEIARKRDISQKHRVLTQHLFSDLKSVNYLLNKGFYIDAKLSDEYSLLIKASDAGSCDLAKQLLQMGTTVNQRNEKGLTPAHVAKRYNMLKLLLEHGADVEARENEKSASVLHHVAAFGTYEAFRLLVEKGADVNSKDGRGYTVLHYAAASRCSYDKVKYLLKKGAQQTQAIDGTSIMQEAIGKDVDLPKLLYNEDIGGEELNRIMHKAVEKQDFETLEFLLAQKGWDVNDKGRKGQTPLHYAVAEGYYNMAHTLLKVEAKVDVFDRYNNTPLHDTTNLRDFEMVKLLLTNGAPVNVNVQDAEGDTPLHLAIRCDDISIAKLLVENGADRTITNARGRTAVQEVECSGYTNVVKYLQNQERLT